MNPGIEAARKLAHLGYRFAVVGESIKAKYEGTGEPNPGLVRPLLDLVKTHKDEVRHFLKCYCPQCGGGCFCPDYEGEPLCLSCDWQELTRLYPALRVKH